MNPQLNQNPVKEFDPPIYVEHENLLYDVPCARSKFYYNMLLQRGEAASIKSVSKWVDKYDILADDFTNVWQCKVKDIKDKRIAETNYKILHFILPCNKNLYRWKKKESALCSICLETEDIEHLLFSCKYARAIWKQIEYVLNIEISIESVLFGTDTRKDMNVVFSIICHLIYKEWLELSLENRERTCITGLKSIKHDLLFHRDVYKGHYRC